MVTVFPLNQSKIILLLISMIKSKISDSVISVIMCSLTSPGYNAILEDDTASLALACS